MTTSIGGPPAPHRFPSGRDLSWDVDVAIVGAGMFGAAAGKYLSRAGENVLVIGPAEPDPGMPIDQFSFGSHFDEARITRRLGWDPVWQATDARSLDRFRAIEVESGVDFFRECGSLVLMAKSIDHRTEDMMRQCDDDAILVERLPADALRQSLPMLNLPALPGGVEGLWERKQAGYINPRQLVKAQLDLTRDAGGQVLRAAVLAVRKESPSGRWRLLVDQAGRRFEVGAERVLITAGALTNQNNVLPAGRELAMHVFAEPNLLFQVADEQLALFEELPPVVTIDPDDTGNANKSIYLLPPIRYPDGNSYIRIGPGMQPIVQEFTDTQEMVSWCTRQRITERQAGFLGAMVRLLLPELRPVDVHEACCLIDKTPSRYPYIGHLDDDETFTVAVGGNGHGARGSDEIGRLASTVVLGQPWQWPLPQEIFRPLLVGDEASVGGSSFHKPPFGLC
ncbi:MAG TPA: FAD-dependent oxidoreductase [Pseudonocardiaceae bacterium]|jgi:sarcosine oxidase